MRKLVSLSALALMACGSSSNTSVAGMMGGASFSAAESVAMVVAPQTCPIPNVGSVPITAVAVAFASTTGTCSTLTGLSGGQCVAQRDAKNLTVVIARFPVAGSSQPSIGPGQYTLGESESSIQFDQSTGMGTVAFAQGLQTDAACTPTPHALSTDSAHPSTINLTEVSSTRVAGHVDITFGDGGTIQGDFDASACGSTPDVCVLATSTSGLCTSGMTCQ